MKQCLLVAGMLLALSGDVLADDSYLEARQLVREGKILSLEQIIDRIDEFRPGQILEVEVEREHDGVVYEIELLDADGNVWELKVDAASGEILEREQED